MRCFALYKPFGVLSQFTDEDGHSGLLSLGLGLPKDVWPIGRLDRDSEGMLLLTDSAKLKADLTAPDREHTKSYWVQVEGAPSNEELEPMRHPMVLRIRKKDVRIRPASVQIIDPPIVPERVPPIRERRHIPTTWLCIELTEGKNRQIRKMTAKVGFPTLRIVRFGTGRFTLAPEALLPGKCIELSSEQMKLLLHANT